MRHAIAGHAVNTSL